jgi:N4-gp56 family major capsid protein
MSSTTTGLSNLMSIYYDKVFLDREKMILVYDNGAQIRPVPKNDGKTVYFNRFAPLPVATTPLTEAAVPTAVDMTSNIVSATVAEYGSYTKVGSLFEMTSIDVNLKEHVDTMGQNAGETIDTLIRDELDGGGTTQLAGGKSNITAIAATDTLTGSEVRKARRTLMKNKAQMFSNGLFRAIVPTSAAYDLMGNSEWLNARQYVDPANIQNGQLGKLYGVEFYETNNEVSVSSTVTVYTSFFYGRNAYGIVNIAGAPGRRIYVKTPNDNDTSNPVNTWSTVGWKQPFAVKVLNSSWLIEVKTGVTA